MHSVQVITCSQFRDIKDHCGVYYVIPHVTTCKCGRVGYMAFLLVLALVPLFRSVACWTGMSEDPGPNPSKGKKRFCYICIIYLQKSVVEHFYHLFVLNFYFLLSHNYLTLICMHIAVSMHVSNDTTGDNMTFNLD